jgi:hypothetical protein
MIEIKRDVRGSGTSESRRKEKESERFQRYSDHHLE